VACNGDPRADELEKLKTAGNGSKFTAWPRGVPAEIFAL
jgi:hypothetical protein